MEWAKLMSTEKLSSEPPEPDSFKEYPINAFEKDYSRIVSSAVVFWGVVCTALLGKFLNPLIGEVLRASVGNDL